MTIIAITGGNGDVGVEALKQLSKVEEVTKIIITCRTAEKAKSTIDSAVATTGKDLSFFGYVLLDVMDYSSIIQAVKDLPKVDRLCLNVGGLGKCELHPSGATDCVVVNALGHSVLLDKMIEAKKISAGSRVIYVGSEVSHDMGSFTGLLPHYYGRFAESYIETAISETYSDLLAKALPVRAQLGNYKNAKIIGQLYISHVATEHSDIHFMTISPGGIGGKDGKGTGFANEGFFPLNTLMKHAPYLFKWMGVTHTIEEGTSRMIDGVLTGPPAWETGSIVLSKRDFFGFGHWGAKGGVEDVRPFVPYLNDASLAKKVAEKVREYQVKWESL